MELLYIWIESYKNIQNQGFNFSPNFQFHYDHKEDTLTVKESESPLPSDFFGENISNVTAIVGENGSGKSSVLEIIIELISSNHLHGHSKCNHILGVNLLNASIREKNLDGLPFKCFAVFNDSKHLFNSNCIKGIKILQELKKEQIKNPNFINPIVYFSNIIQNKKAKETDFRFNVSSNFFLKLDTTNIHRKSSSKHLDRLDLYFTEDLERFIFFINYQVKNNVNYLGFKLPTYLELTFPKVNPLSIEIENINSISSIDQTFLHKVYSLYNEILNRFNKSTYFDNSKHQIIIEKKYTILYNFLNVLLNNILLRRQDLKSLHQTAFIQNKDWYNQYDLSKINAPDEILNFSYEYIQEISSNLVLDFLDKNENLLDWATSIADVLLFFWQQVDNTCKDLPDTFHDILSNWQSAYYNHYSILIPLDDLDLATKATYCQNQLLAWQFRYLNQTNQAKEFNFIHYTWQGLSSGQEQMLLFFARLFDVKGRLASESKNNIKYDDSLENLIILLDEAELALHPQWQKEFINLLLKFLQQVFKQNIQIIFTTHSPFLLSDLPKQNVIFLKKDKSEGNAGKCIVVDGINVKENTFAANIHTLLADGFFMKGGLIGDFAKQKLQGLIQDIEQFEQKYSTQNEHKKRELQQVINLIGEPIIKNKLQQFYNEKLMPKGIDAEIQDLENKLEALKKRKKNQQ